MEKRKPNRLIGEKSPYLLQHAHNPVDWYPWGEEAFARAAKEDKPVFLSIGYSTCHWCHVMERESFEDAEVAELLNKHFVAVKVDREERPDVDNIYMRVCQALTGGGGWPTSIFMTLDKKPFFAGTYFPKAHFLGLLRMVGTRWAGDRSDFVRAGEELTASLQQALAGGADEDLAPPVEEATGAFRRAFDAEYGGFGTAPKFPSPHNLMFLLGTGPDMAEKTLEAMYKGGIFDHVGYGFSRYSTDRYWFAPHFEKMLYDNALLAIAYLMAYERTGRTLYREVAEKIFVYLEREMRSPEGGFYTAQDADSGEDEGGYYLFTPGELTALLGAEDGARFCARFGVTEAGNFEGKNILNLLNRQRPDLSIDRLRPLVYDYRKKRMPLATDRKILTCWNALTAAAYATAGRILGWEEYLITAEKILNYIEQVLTDGDTLYSGVTDGKRGAPGFLDDYAYFIFALICMHQATGDGRFLARAEALTEKVTAEYFDKEAGGFYFSGRQNEAMIFAPKETYDGATPSGNSVMAYNLKRLAALTKSDKLYELQKKQEAFMNGEAQGYPAGSGFYLYSALPAKEVTCALAPNDDLGAIRVKSDWIFKVADDPAYPLLNEKTTFYVCTEGACLPATNEVPE
ncbi:MAG TPA: thioredoxin domain-containing protein [Candidatus Acidoferrum sp.]|nr:thioredoxin domain-containing protein [Candidatus Acidoferrum sp.]